MKVRDLIKQLEKFDGDMEIYKEFEMGGGYYGATPLPMLVKAVGATQKWVCEDGSDAGEKPDPNGYPSLVYLDDKRVRPDLGSVKGDVALAI